MSGHATSRQLTVSLQMTRGARDGDAATSVSQRSAMRQDGRAEATRVSCSSAPKTTSADERSVQDVSIPTPSSPARLPFQAPRSTCLRSAPIDLSPRETKHQLERPPKNLGVHIARGSAAGRDAMMLWFGPLTGSGLGLALLLGLAEGVVLAILVSVLAESTGREVYLPVAPGLAICTATAQNLRSRGRIVAIIVRRAID